MAKRTSKSLILYFSQIIIKTIAIIIGLAISCLVILTLAFNFNIVYPANQGESQAHQVIKELETTRIWQSDLPIAPADYILFNQANEILETSFSAKSIDRVLSEFPDSRGTYQTATSIDLDNNQHVLIVWRYNVLFTNALLRKILPPFELCLLYLLIIIVIAYFSYLVYQITRTIKRNLSKLNTANELIATRNLSEPFDTDSEITEFAETLAATEMMRQELNNSLKQQWQLEQDRKHEISALIHDIKTPLTVIMGNAELLAEDDIASEQKTLILEIEKATNRAQNYLQNLQELANLDSVDDTLSDIDLFTFLNDLSTTVLRITTPKNIAFTITNDDQLTVIMANYSLLMRALINLIDNSVRYTNFGGTIELIITSQIDYVFFTIKDTGQGFSSEALKHADQIFWQAETSRTATTNYGLGLAIVKKISAKHNGYLTLANTQNGAKVTIAIKK